MTIGIIGSGAIGTAFARTLAAPASRRRSRTAAARIRSMIWSASWAHRSRPERARKPHAPTSSSSPSTGRNCRQRWRAFRTGPAALSSTPTIRSRRRCSSRPIYGPRVKRGGRRSRARSARRQGVQSSPRRSAGRATRDRTAAGACCSIPAMTARRRRRWRPSYRPHRLRRHRSWIPLPCSASQVLMTSRRLSRTKNFVRIRTTAATRQIASGLYA